MKSTIAKKITGLQNCSAAGAKLLVPRQNSFRRTSVYCFCVSCTVVFLKSNYTSTKEGESQTFFGSVRLDPSVILKPERDNAHENILLSPKSNEVALRICINNIATHGALWLQGQYNASHSPLIMLWQANLLAQFLSSLSGLNGIFTPPSTMPRIPSKRPTVHRLPLG
mmetsp:Transcript_46365/g.140435  ORF Transcript_46365/g.140435 Transcript_46365/m.140435 type:complete len:168 (+) Transcript_46365:100-603(+)